MALTKITHQSMPSGSVLQVVQTALTSAVAVSAPTSFTDTSGVSVAITPKFSSSKVLINVSLVAEAHTADFHAVFRLVRGSTAIGVGDANSSAPQVLLWLIVMVKVLCLVIVLVFIFLIVQAQQVLQHTKFKY